MTATRCLGAVLAGGSGSRLGGAAKGLAEVGGARIIDRVASALAAACDRVILVANDPAATGWLPGIVVVPDRRAGVGAAGGIHAALHAAAGDDLIVVAWDLPFVTGALLQALHAAAAGADGAVCSRPGSRWGVEPLCACYRASCLPALERRLDAGDTRAGAWLGDVQMATLDRDALSRLGDPDVLLMDVDTPQDLDEARRLAGAAA